MREGGGERGRERGGRGREGGKRNCDCGGGSFGRESLRGSCGEKEEREKSLESTDVYSTVLSCKLYMYQKSGFHLHWESVVDDVCLPL